MNNSLQDTLALVGRILLAWLFVPAGFGKIAGFSGAVGYATSVGLPLPEVGVAVGLLIELVGGLMLLVGFMTRPAAVLLAFFTLVASFFFHAYWSLPADQAMMQQLMFNKNIAISGGLLAFAAFGAGRWSLDAKRQRV
ncbi:DoxX family protein [Comamonas aquatica]|jgi:putative oxidoreductase|uniref:LysR family transcriptional regulator n=2 Tax=Comamonas aquatica TaxID=225991 RepID=A0A014MEA1_9BURK|nr:MULTISPECIES: DoxX family protein [Comamonas]EXU80091.1 LysR family transcriptional regulator [Comamonas aquatica DA1877]MDH0372690.1 DoxX family protein [Comamonas aquatica]MDH0381863.1 DoxX family protein [Comamonas aquatica]MDH0430008.1 DoxX family protein [Comamonas aquatica]MDH0494115.1 DoxX family protein [Comamonas aquatica]